MASVCVTIASNGSNSNKAIKLRGGVVVTIQWNGEPAEQSRLAGGIMAISLRNGQSASEVAAQPASSLISPPDFPVITIFKPPKLTVEICKFSPIFQTTLSLFTKKTHVFQMLVWGLFCFLFRVKVFNFL